MDCELFEFSLRFQDGKHQCITNSLPCVAGRGEDSPLRIRSWRVSKKHARFFQLAEGVYVEDFGSISGTYLNQIRISRAGPLGATDEIVIGTCKIRVSRLKDPIPQDGFTTNHRADVYDHLNDAHADSAVGLDKLVENRLPVEAKSSSVPSELKSCPSIESVCAEFPVGQASLDPQTHLSSTSEHESLFDKLRMALFHRLDVRKQDITGMSIKDLREYASQLLEDIVSKDFKDVEDDTVKKLTSSLLDEAFGFGLIQPLLSDPGVSEIMVNRYDQVFVERNGLLKSHPLRFSSESALRTVIDRMLQSAGKRVDEGSPMADARLADGSRLNAVVPPISLHGACLTVRKFPDRKISLEAMVAQQSMSPEVFDYLKLSVLNRKSILISGGTGTGKTTLLNALISAVSPSERLITIEDAAELRLPVTSNHVSLETRPSNTEGQGLVTIRDLVRNALRMRPDRIVIGECRGGEALDMLSAMNTGHEGSMATLHANSPRDAISRLENLVLMAQQGLPSAAIREQIASAIDLIVQLKRLSTGKRVISAVACITGIESGVLQLQMMFEPNTSSHHISSDHQWTV